MKILIVEDNKLLGESMKRGLSELGWIVDLTLDGESALQKARSAPYQLFLFDRMLPKMSGTELIKTLRKDGIKTPVIMVTARDELGDRISGLNEGADDYMVKPFELIELIARCKAMFRRSLQEVNMVLEFGQVQLNLDSRIVLLRGEKVEVTPKEFDFLAILAGKPGHIFTRVDLHGLLYELEAGPGSNTLDVLLARIRRKLGSCGCEIETIRGKGFVLRVESISA